MAKKQNDRSEADEAAKAGEIPSGPAKKEKEDESFIENPIITLPTKPDTYVYAVLGAGMQGTAAVYDLVKFGDAEKVFVFDSEHSQAQRCATRINKLLKTDVVEAIQLDISSLSAPKKLRSLVHIDAVLSAVPYKLNERLASLFVGLGTHFNDLGGNTEVVEKELELNEEAVKNSVSVVPDCGVAPGMINILARLEFEKFEKGANVRLFCGGLPQNKDLLFGYKLLFSPEGLTNEYSGKARVLRNGQLQEIDTFEELETVSGWPKAIGDLQAFTTSGGVSKDTESFADRLSSYEYKTLRYPGHFGAVKALKRFGLLEERKIRTSIGPISPREVFHTLAKIAWKKPEEKDLLCLRVEVSGTEKISGKQLQLTTRLDLVDYQDVETGFSAMERTTAFGASIVTIMQAKGEIVSGASTPAVAVDPKRYMEELERRGFLFDRTVV